MKVSKNRIHILDSAIGVLCCASAAALASFLLHGRQLGIALVVIFLALITLVALRFGTAAGVMGSLSAALIFALFLYRPLGSLVVSHGDARSNLGWLLVGGLTLSVLFAPPQRNRHHR